MSFTKWQIVRENLSSIPRCNNSWFDFSYLEAELRITMATFPQELEGLGFARNIKATRWRVEVVIENDMKFKFPTSICCIDRFDIQLN
jgi:hypothetical protein